MTKRNEPLVAGLVDILTDKVVGFTWRIEAGRRSIPGRESSLPYIWRDSRTIVKGCQTGERALTSGDDEMKEKDDWRLQGQERYLRGVTLIRRKYRQYPRNPEWDHDHCEFCWATFSLLDNPDYLKEGYATKDDYRWICPACFEDFKDDFDWTVTGDQ
jgi:hypothetical protein